MRRAALILLALLFVAPLATGGLVSVAAQEATPTPTANATATPEPTPTQQDIRQERISELSNANSAPYNYTWLNSPPTVPYPDRYPSMRPLAEPARAFVGVQYQDPTIFDVFLGSEPAYGELGVGDQVRVNDLQVYASTEGTYNLTVVYWQRNQTRVNDSEVNRPIPYAYNQTVEHKTIRFEGGELYKEVNVSLVPHYDETVFVTMWLRNSDGERVAKWTFKHRSNPQFKAVDISNLLDAWRFAFINAFGPSIAFGIAGMFAGKVTLRGWGPFEGVGRGPGFGASAWGVVLFIVGMFTVPTAGFYMQVAILLEHAGWLMGAFVGAAVYAYQLTDHNEVLTVGFFRRELFDARDSAHRLARAMSRGEDGDVAADGGLRPAAEGMQEVREKMGGSADVFEELTDAFYYDLPEMPVVKSGGEYKVVPPGVGAFLAALFVGRRTFDPEQVATREIGRKGRIDYLVHLDPTVPLDDALINKAEGLVNQLPWLTLKQDYADKEASPTTPEKAFAALTSVLILLAPPVGLMLAFAQVWNLGPVGFAIGTIVTATIMLTAEEGWLEFELAPVHYLPVEQHLPILRRGYKEANEEETAIDRARRVEAITVQEARDDRESEEETYLDVILEDRQPPKDGGSS